VPCLAFRGRATANLRRREVTAMHVAICIVGFRNAGDIAACLDALSRSAHEDFEVRICENGGPDAYRALIEAVPSKLPGGQPVHLVEASGNLGYAGGVNVGLAESPGADAWWVLNPDTLPDRGALEALVRRLAAGDCDLVGGVLYGDDHRVQTLGGRWRPWLARAESIGRGRSLEAIGPARDIEREIDFVSGASMLISARFLQKVGPMREDYFIYCEEVEWCLRARERGIRIGVAANARVLHHQGSSTGSAAALAQRPRLQVYLDERNKILLTKDHFRWRIPVAAPAALLLIFLRFGTRGALPQVGFALQGWWAGIVGKRGMPTLV
jgi:N-acetylglucosaminyl-diphospho-decaprenol L-rhamnosyltransferase